MSQSRPDIYALQCQLITSRDTGVCLDNLSMISLERKRYEQAAQFSLQALRMLMAKLPANDVKIATAERHYGQSLGALHRFDDAKTQYLAAYSILTAQETVPGADVEALRALLVVLYHLKKEPGKALRFR